MLCKPREPFLHRPAKTDRQDQQEDNPVVHENPQVPQPGPGHQHGCCQHLGLMQAPGPKQQPAKHDHQQRIYMIQGLAGILFQNPANPQPLRHNEDPIVNPPADKIHTGPMPQPGCHEYHKQVDAGPCKPLAVAAQGYVEILLKPGGQGYCADIYNPFSLFNAFDAKEYKNFWFSTGTPTFLIDILQRTDFDVQSLDGLTATDEQFDAPTDHIVDPIPVLYQSGYLTIKGYDPAFRLYRLAYSNGEVRYGFTESLLPALNKHIIW